MASRVFGESVGNCYWRHFNLAKAVAAIIAMKLYRHYLNLADRRQTAKLKTLPNKLHIRYSVLL